MSSPTDDEKKAFRKECRKKRIIACLTNTMNIIKAVDLQDDCPEGYTMEEYQSLFQSALDELADFVVLLEAELAKEEALIVEKKQLEAKAIKSNELDKDLTA